jgi:hypothetical protein
MIHWFVVDSVGKEATMHSTRASARLMKRDLEGPESLEPWNYDLVYPLHIEREEWQLVRRERVR